MGDYKGGVLIISHNKEFCDNVAAEKEAKAADLGPKEDVYDGFGNKIDVKAAGPTNAKDIKKQIKDLEKKLKDGKKKGTLSDDEVWEIEDKLVELKEKLEKA